MTVHTNITKPYTCMSHVHVVDDQTCTGNSLSGIAGHLPFTKHICSGLENQLWLPAMNQIALRL